MSPTSVAILRASLISAISSSLSLITNNSLLITQSSFIGIGLGGLGIIYPITVSGFRSNKYTEPKNNLFLDHSQGAGALDARRAKGLVRAASDVRNEAISMGRRERHNFLFFGVHLTSNARTSVFLATLN
jgi:hypothetical protein